MSSQALFRLSGFTLIFGSILLALGCAISSLILLQGPIGMYTAASAVPAYALRIVGATLVLLGMPAIFVRQAQSTRSVILGLIGLIMTFIGIATIEVGMNSAFAYVFSPLASNPATQTVIDGFNVNKPLSAQIAFPTGLLLEVFGPLVLGIAILRAKSFSRLTGVMFILVTVFGFLALPDILVLQAVTGIGSAVVLALGFCFCGLALWSAQGIKSDQNMPVDTEKRGEPIRV